MQQFINKSKNERKAIFQITAEQMRLPLSLIEKDFWVCFVLSEIFNDNVLKKQFFFKGGTSLSKAFHLINRFSEDIDLVLDSTYIQITPTTPLLSKNQQNKFDKQLVAQTETYIEDTLKAKFDNLLERFLKVEIDKNNRTHILLQYEGVTERHNYIRNEVKLEINAIAEKCPNQRCLVQPYIAEERQLNITGVEIPTISAERTFWEKATILHNESLRPLDKPMPTRYSRHYYDLYKLGTSKIKEQAFSNLNLLQQVCNFKASHFCSSWSDYASAASLQFTLVPNNQRVLELEKDYEQMQEMIYEENTPAWVDIITYLQNLEDEIKQISTP